MAFILKVLLTLMMIGCVTGSSLGSRPRQSNNQERNEVPKSLDFGITSLPPHFFLKDGKIRGSDVLILELVAKKLDFKINVVKVVAGGPNALVQTVTLLLIVIGDTHIA